MVMLFCLVLESLLDLEYLPLSEEQNVTTPPQGPSPIANPLILILTVTHRPRLAAAGAHPCSQRRQNQVVLSRLNKIVEVKLGSIVNEYILK
jgi:hypothetical protein